MPLDAWLLGSCLMVTAGPGLTRGAWVGTTGSAAPCCLSPQRQMASGLLIGLTEDELLAIKAKAVAMITEGKTLMSYSDSGSSATKQFAMSPKEMLSEAMWALSKLDPLTYGSRRSVISTNWNNPIDE